MLSSVDCSGHPRDMGLAQGRALAPAVAERLRTAGLPTARPRLPSLGAFTNGGVRGGGVGREIIRHYTHLAERMDGLARGAGVPVDGVLALHARAYGAAAGGVDARPAVAIAAVGLEDSPGVTVARSLSGGLDEGSSLVVRRSRPEVGFESVEVTLPWLATALAGVNDAGLTACIVPRPLGDDRAAGGPSPLLLVQECLQRFESVAGAIGWCSRRPVHGRATLLLADADGARTSVRFAGAERKVEPAAEDVVTAGGPDALRDSLRQAATSERLLDEKALCPADDSTRSPAWVRLIPTRRSLELRRPTGPVEELLVEV